MATSFFLALGLLSSLPSSLAQTSSVACNATLSWSQNSRSQDPCVVSSYLSAVCSGVFNIDPLAPGLNYIGPTQAIASPCQCSSVVYSLISACAACQSQGFISWDKWRSNCTDDMTYNGEYLYDIPSGTAVPAWAFVKYDTAGEYFNVVNAENEAKNNPPPESTRTTVPSSTSGSQSNPSSTSSAATSSSGKTNVGAIAGGVVGGVVGLAIIIGAVVFFMCRKRKRRAPSAQYKHESLKHGGAMNPPGEYHQYQSTPFIHSPTPDTPNMSMKPYDPSDPSTFPTNTAPSLYSDARTTSHPPSSPMTYDPSNPATFPNANQYTFGDSYADSGHPPSHYTSSPPPGAQNFRGVAEL